jgi:hypothetical protein
MRERSRTRPAVKQQKSQRKIRSLTWALVLSPLVVLFVFVTLAAHVRLGLGHWPMPMLESYATTAYSRHVQVFVWFARFAVYGAIPLWIVALCFRRFRISLKTHLIQAVVYVAGWVFIGIYGMVDPGSFAEWFLD